LYRLPTDAARPAVALGVLTQTGDPGLRELQDVLEPAMRAAAALLRLANPETSVGRFFLDVFERLPVAVLDRPGRERLVRLLNARGGADWLDNSCEAVAHLLDIARANAGRAGKDDTPLERRLRDSLPAKQQQLVSLLEGAGAVSEEEVIQALWPDERSKRPHWISATAPPTTANSSGNGSGPTGPSSRTLR
jgi:hypothetical protein